jgi:hypothetical protein
MDFTISAGYCNNAAAKTGSLATEYKHPDTGLVCAILTNVLPKEYNAHHLGGNLSNSSSEGDGGPA